MISKLAARRLRELFLDEFCSVYLRDMNVVTINEQQQEVKISPVAEGVIVDVCEEFIYLGLPNGEILKTIPHATVGMIELGLVTAGMEEMETAGDGEEVH